MDDELKRALNAIMAFKSEIAPPPPDRIAIAATEIARLEARVAELEAQVIAGYAIMYDQGRDAERADVVAWLRGDRPSDYTDPQYDIGVNLARGIEANAHRSNPDA